MRLPPFHTGPPPQAPARWPALALAAVLLLAAATALAAPIDDFRQRVDDRNALRAPAEQAYAEVRPGGPAEARVVLTPWGMTNRQALEGLGAFDRLLDDWAELNGGSAMLNVLSPGGDIVWEGSR